MRYAQTSIRVTIEEAEEVEMLLWDREIPYQRVDASTIDAQGEDGVCLVVYDSQVDEEFSVRVQEALDQLADRLNLSIEKTWSDDAEWKDRWKAFFHTRRIPPFVLVPSWEEDVYVSQPGEYPLFLDPGRAFGTGGHASTRLCLQLIGHLPIGFASAVDVGCGSGILAFAVLKRDVASFVWALDNDPEAIEVTEENAVKNKLTDRLKASTDPISSFTHRTQVLLANLTGPTLLALCDDLTRIVLPGGHLVLSGILQTEAATVQKAFERRGFILQERLLEEEWAAFWLRSGSHA